MKKRLLVAVYVLFPFAWLYYVYRHRESIKRAAHFAWLGWKGHDWDYEFIEKAYGVMLKRQLNYFQSDRSFVDWTEPEAKRSLKALAIASKYLTQEVNRADRISLPQPFYTLEKTEKSDIFEMRFIKSEKWDEYLRLSREDDRLNEKRKQAAYRIIAKYRLHWWD